MSHTIVHDQAKRDLENVVNRVLRHCKIGKVTRKAVGIDQFGLLSVLPRSQDCEPRPWVLPSFYPQASSMS